MRTRSRALIVVIAVQLVTATLCAGQAAYFDDGNQRYQAGDFAGALERYLDVLETGVESGEIYYNIGNSYFKLGQLGPAILYYERAWRLLPGDDDVRANLELARSLTIDDITPLPRFWLFRVVEWWVDLVPPASLRWLVGLTYALTMLTVITLVLNPAPSLRRWIRRGAIGGTAITLVFGTNLFVRELGLGRADEAIVMGTEVLVQSAPSDDEALQIFAVHEGIKVRIDRRSKTWAEIVLADGKVGWIRADQLEVI